MKKVTVITSMFKAGQYIEGFIEDIIDQTAFDDCTWYLLDAYSPDNEYEIIHPYLSKYNNIKYERLDHDPGLYACWNYMIKNSRSEYVSNSNVDDRLLPQCLERHIEVLDQNHNYDLAYCENAITHHINDSYKNYKYLEEVTTYPTGPFNRAKLLHHCYPSTHPVWRRSLHDKFGFFNENYKSVSDHEFWLRCIANGSQDFIFIPEILGIYYYNPLGVSTNPDNNNWKHKEEFEVRQQYSNLLH